MEVDKERGGGIGDRYREGEIDRRSRREVEKKRYRDLNERHREGQIDRHIE